MKKFLTLFLLSLQLNILHSESIEIGCDITLTKEESCDQGDIFAIERKESLFKLNDLKKEEQEPLLNFNSDKKTINITTELSSISILYQKKRFTILRTPTIKNQSCPPSCLQELTIKNIKTVGTLETLEFIKKLNRNKRMILVDARVVSEYKKQTIPTATNIPNSILQKKSKHIEVILRLLGAIKDEEKWIFNHLHTLLIFDNGILDHQANKLILRLIELGYPQKKILYYHGGIETWKNVGLTTV
ncbi:MAG: hypothetical protein KAG56_02780 [Sulfurovaceae bacterium]|nr:hypothetical protein [Sulfurovaceae bacterium]